MADLHILMANEERMKDRMREADLHRLAISADKSEARNVVGSARNLLGKSLIMVGQHLMNEVER